jgi:hypothetical protein
MARVYVGWGDARVRVTVEHIDNRGIGLLWIGAEGLIRGDPVPSCQGPAPHAGPDRSARHKAFAIRTRKKAAHLIALRLSIEYGCQRRSSEWHKWHQSLQWPPQRSQTAMATSVSAVHFNVPVPEQREPEVWAAIVKLRRAAQMEH